MGHRIQLVPRGSAFEAGENESILDAALRNGIPLRYGCRHGNCSTCKYLVRDGDVDLGHASPYSLSEQEREDGWALLCCANALSDLEIEVPEDAGDRLRPAITPQEHRARVARNDRVSRTLVRLRLELEDDFTFYPGQFLEIAVPDEADQWRSYSMASSPSRTGEVDLIIQKLPGGVFSERLDSMVPGTPMRFRGPYGSSYLRDGDRPILLVSGGSGVAPILSILEFLTLSNDARPVEFFYGVRTRADLPLAEEISALSLAHPCSKWTPALSEPSAECDWTGHVGMVAQVLQAHLRDASPYDAYICGPPPMCDSVSVILAAKGLPEERAFLDRFYTAAR